MNRAFWIAVTILIQLVLSFAFSQVAAAGFTERTRVSADSLELYNLIGEVRVEGHGGSDFEIEIAVRGKDASRDRITIETEGKRVTIGFPVDEERDYVYPALGNTSRHSFSPESADSSWFSRLLGRDQITVRDRGRGLELWADVTVKVPRGADFAVYHGVGEIHATGVVGDLNLDGSVGDVFAQGIEGSLLADTGSGDVNVDGLVGDLDVDTGSGSVALHDVSGESIRVDTGSGDVRGDSVRSETLDVDTGSGSVKLAGLSADSARVDTGSGSVTLAFAGIGDGTFDVDTGSGSISLALPEGASVSVDADTGSGGISLEREDATIHHRERNELVATVGAGDARFKLSTGSGGISIR